MSLCLVDTFVECLVVKLQKHQPILFFNEFTQHFAHKKNNVKLKDILADGRWRLPNLQSDLKEIGKLLQQIKIRKNKEGECIWTPYLKGHLSIATTYEVLQNHYPRCTWSAKLWENIHTKAWVYRLVSSSQGSEHAREAHALEYSYFQTASSAIQDSAALE